MAISDCDGKTFVAFIDISGFKNLMKKGKAAEALNSFYNFGYEILNEQNGTKNNVFVVDGIFVSDCGILVARKKTENSVSESKDPESLLKLLEAVEKINKKMLEKDYMLTTSITYGQFKYENRLECVGIEKSSIIGNAYISAFLDNENGTPKIKSGQCRIVKKNLPDEINNCLNNVNNNRIFNKVKEKDEHYYFYWMVDEVSKIVEFEEQYSTAIDLKYKGMLKALKGERVGCCNRENDI